jgi:hypothetical protein
LVGTTVFGSAISMSGTVVADYKNSLYIGNRPYHISKGNIMGVVPGAVLGAAVAIFLSDLLANGKIDLLAPQANAFASFTIVLESGNGDFNALFLGMLLGAFAEWATGMGTSFGLGMYLPTPYTLPMLIGGGLRDKWEEKKLKPVVDEIREKDGTAKAEQKRALMLLMTFMIAAGALTGEAFFGVESAVFAVTDEMKAETTFTADDWTDSYLDEYILGEYEDEANFSSAITWALQLNAGTPENDTMPCSDITESSITCNVNLAILSWYPMVRMVAFIGVNVVLAAAVVALFARAGVVSFGKSESEDDIIEAEIVK